MATYRVIKRQLNNSGLTTLSIPSAARLLFAGMETATPFVYLLADITANDETRKFYTLATDFTVSGIDISAVTYAGTINSNGIKHVFEYAGE